jgi:membrane fusion protein (multidrug efflux system)
VFAHCPIAHLITKISESTLKTNWLLSLLCFAALVIGCSDKGEQAPPVIEIVATQVALSPYRESNSYVGRLEAAQDVTIQAKVSGYLTERLFNEGQHIEQGAKLYTIDPASFKALKEQAQADVERGNAKVKVSTRNFQRGQQLIKTGVISASQMDELEATYYEAIASAKAAAAAFDSASINLADSIIVAPISGQIGKSLHYVGDLVGPDVGALTTIVDTQTVNAIFSIDQKTLLAVYEARIQADDLAATEGALNVLIKLSDDSIYPHIGRLDYLDNRIDEGTGTAKVSAIIPNPDGLLRHGQYVKVIVQAAEPIDVLMVPQATVQSDQAGDFVLWVDDNKTVARAEVSLGTRVRENVVVNSGLVEGQNIILQGIQKVRVGQTVKMRIQPLAENSADTTLTEPVSSEQLMTEDVSKTDAN